VEVHGEHGLVFLGGEHTHTVQRLAALSGRPGYDSTAALPALASQAERTFAREVLAATGFELLYARVDVAPDADGAPRLMELEVTEPNLFLRQGGPPAVRRLVDALLDKL